MYTLYYSFNDGEAYIASVGTSVFFKREEAKGGADEIQAFIDKHSETCTLVDLDALIK